MSGLTPDVMKAFKSTRDLIQSAKRDVADYTDKVKYLTEENDEGIIDLADLASENDGAIIDLADRIANLEKRMSIIEEKLGD